MDESVEEDSGLFDLVSVHLLLFDEIGTKAPTAARVGAAHVRVQNAIESLLVVGALVVQPVKVERVANPLFVDFAHVAILIFITEMTNPRQLSVHEQRRFLLTPSRRQNKSKKSN